MDLAGQQARFVDRSGFGYDADIPHLRASYGVPLLTFAERARSKGP
jgi:hypothetical protein